MTKIRPHRGAPFLAAIITLAGCGPSGSPGAPAPSASPGSAAKGSAVMVGPPHGAVIVVGGGAQGPEVFAKLIELAGGPNALILDIPTAGGDSVYPANWRGQNGLKAAGAKNVLVLHTVDRSVANSDSFVAPIKKAGGIWFEGGRHFHLVDSYLGTKTERELYAVLERGGVASGSSAGASILGSFLVRGAPSNNNNIMAYPGYLKGFAYLRGVGIDQHVVARERLADLADSLMHKYPDSLFISEDEGTAWVVQGDIAEIIGRDKAFVYNGKDATDAGKPFLTLHPGDKYDLARRRVVHRAIDESPLTQKFIDGVFADFAKPGAPQATVLVAENGKVFIDAAYNVPPQRKFMPETTIPNFALGGLSDGFNATAALDLVRSGKLKLDDRLSDQGTVTVGEYLSRVKDAPNGGRDLVQLLAKRGGAKYPALLERRIYTPIGMHKTVADTLTGELHSNVDELYRWELGLTATKALTEEGTTNVFKPVSGMQSGNALGWTVDSYKGMLRESAFGTRDGKRNAFVRFPEKHAVIIILTNDANADARKLADTIADKLFSR